MRNEEKRFAIAGRCCGGRVSGAVLLVVFGGRVALKMLAECVCALISVGRVVSALVHEMSGGLSWCDLSSRSTSLSAKLKDQCHRLWLNNNLRAH